MFRRKLFHSFPIKGSDEIGKIELITNPSHINKDEAKAVLVESFIGEYQKYLTPNEISEGLTSWRDGDKSVQKYYEDYFKTELEEYTHAKVDYWIQATVNGKLAGWATFQREKSDSNALYMNLLVVHPNFQHKGIGAQLIRSTINLNEKPNLREVHLLLRKKNEGGRIFYSKFGFVSDPKYNRADNFVDTKLLEGWTWKNPVFLNRNKYITFGLFAATAAFVATKILTNPSSESKPRPSV